MSDLKKDKSDNERKVRYGVFLKDVFVCSLGAFGGPEAHYGVFIDQLVTKKKYITEEEMTEFIALTGILPGPSSTQTIIGIGHKLGGPLLGFLTFLVWVLPVIILMTALSFLSDFFVKNNISFDKMRYLSAMAVGFIIMAAYRIGKKVINDKVSFILMVIGALGTYFIREFWIFPAVLILGGIVEVISSKEKGLWNKVSLNPPWKYLILFILLAFGSALLWFYYRNILITLFYSFYRYGYLVIGGGQVVVPMMYGELVTQYGYLNSVEFLSGFGLVQGIPGPMFSFASYAGGLAARGSGALVQIIGGLISGLAIFLPGILLIYFVMPIWEDLKKIKGIKESLRGITSVAVGLILTSALNMMMKLSSHLDNFIIVLLTVILLYTRKVPAPIIVIIMLVLGFIFLK